MEFHAGVGELPLADVNPGRTEIWHEEILQSDR